MVFIRGIRRRVRLAEFVTSKAFVFNNRRIGGFLVTSWQRSSATAPCGLVPVARHVGAVWIEQCFAPAGLRRGGGKDHGMTAVPCNFI